MSGTVTEGRDMMAGYYRFLSILPLSGECSARESGVMHSDDFLAQQVMKANNANDLTPVRRDDRPAVLMMAAALWRGVRHLASGIDAFSSVWHGIEVPADHESRDRREPRRAPRGADDGGTPAAHRPAPVNMRCGRGVN
ncbi:hypothetical protein IM660_19600 [Ruania alkalisoli]|uniref:Uncharacterized protein n=1 Tax=Ruania alkalisoli TaxID=2779775 RepID=A0A7M1STF7_9MICO|nr:hypothetical protein [Ruania alkalisoli]QOR70741.1 hypothetical protein IM660_19600 [Ruania alkalisoli]